MPHDKRLDNPAFREAHKEVSKRWKIIKLRWGSVEACREAAKSDKTAADFIAGYEAALARRRATTAKGA